MTGSCRRIWHRHRAAEAALVLLAGLLMPQPASAKPARCFTTDDGHFACDFVATDRAGSFEISGEGVPTYALIVDEPGVASAFVNFGDRNISLPGRYLRQRDDPACWGSPETDTKICAW